MSSDTPGVDVQWKWGAAVYSSFTTDYNMVAPKAAHSNTCGLNNSDHAGTPEGFRSGGTMRASPCIFPSEIYAYISEFETEQESVTSCIVIWMITVNQF